MAASKIIAAEIDMMQSWTSHRYTVVLSQTQERGSMSGSGLQDAFEMFARPDVALDDFFFILAHENMHYWNGHRIRPESSSNRWFSEGFTNYYTFVVNGRMGLWLIPKTLEEASSEILDYYDNPVAEQIDFADAGKYFWVWREYEKLPYSKGMLIALMTDVRIRRESGNHLTLDGLMRRMDQRFAGSEQSLNDERFI